MLEDGRSASLTQAQLDAGIIQDEDGTLQQSIDAASDKPYLANLLHDTYHGLVTGATMFASPIMQKLTYAKPIYQKVLGEFGGVAINAGTMTLAGAAMEGNFDDFWEHYLENAATFSLLHLQGKAGALVNPRKAYRNAVAQGKVEQTYGLTRADMQDLKDRGYGSIMDFVVDVYGRSNPTATKRTDGNQPIVVKDSKEEREMTDARLRGLLQRMELDYKAGMLSQEELVKLSYLLTGRGGNVNKVVGAGVYVEQDTNKPVRYYATQVDKQGNVVRRKRVSSMEEAERLRDETQNQLQAERIAELQYAYMVQQGEQYASEIDKAYRAAKKRAIAKRTDAQKRLIDTIDSLAKIDKYNLSPEDYKLLSDYQEILAE